MASEGRKFQVELLFKAPIEIDLNAVAAMVNEIAPMSAVAVSPMNPATVLKTNEVIIGILDPVDKANGDRITFIGAGVPDESFRAQDHTELGWRSVPFSEGAVKAIQQHQSYVTLSVTAADDTLASRFRAARQITVVAAAIAQDPQTLGVMCAWAGRMSSPQAWDDAAAQAVQDEWPLMDWISTRGGWDQRNGTQYAVGYTIGVSHFIDFEIHMEAAPIQPTEAMKMLVGASWLRLQGGNTYHDGDTMGHDGPDSVTYRMRTRKRADGTSDNVIVLLHPDSPVDEIAVFGENPRLPAPPGFDNTRRPKKGFMKRLLGR